MPIPTRLNRRQLVALPLLAAAGHLSAQTQAGFPVRPITVIVPFPSGGGADSVARALQPGLAKALAQPVVIVNRPGAAGAIGTAAVASAVPDGHMVLVTLSTLSALPEQARVNGQKPLYEMAQLQPLARLTADSVGLVVRQDSPLKSLDALVAHLKAQPGSLSFASSGNYGPTHLPAEMMLRAAGVHGLHVPFQGGAAMILALQAGQVDFAMLGRTLAEPHIKAGKLRYLAAFDEQRWTNAPDVPTLAESGLRIGYVTWTGAFVPTGTPDHVQDRWRSALRLAVADPAFASVAGPDGGFLEGAALDRFAQRDADQLRRAVQAIGPQQ